MPKSRKPLKKRPPGTGSKPTRRGRRWSMLVTVGRRPDGKQDRRRVTADTPEECLQKARELQVAAAYGLLATHERRTLSDWLRMWLDSKAGRAAPTYLLKLEAHARHIHRCLGGIELRKLRPAHVYDLVRYLEGQGLSPAYQREVLNTLRAALERAVALELIPKNPARPVGLEASARERKVKAWDAQSVSRFLETARGYRLYPLFYLGFATGLRREELLGLRWCDVDLENRLLRVEQVLVPVRGGYHIGPPKTRASRRTLGFGPDVAQVLEEWKRRQEEERRRLGDRWPDTGLVFTTATGRPIHPRNVNRAMQAIIEAHNRHHPDRPLSPLSPHGMRHTHATLLAQRVGQIELVSRRLGHAWPSTTLDLYRHVEEWELERTALPLPELLSPPRGPTGASPGQAGGS